MTSSLFMARSFVYWGESGRLGRTAGGGCRSALRHFLCAESLRGDGASPCRSCERQKPCSDWITMLAFYSARRY